MSLRNCLLTWLASLGAAFLSGCVTSSAQTRFDPREFVPELPDLRARGPESPYHQQPGGAAAEVKRPNPPKPVAEEPPPLRRDDPPSALPPLPDRSRPSARTAETAPAPPQETRKNTAGDEPLVVALRAYLQKRPGDALEALSRYDRANQDMLLVALPFAARLTEGNIDKVSPREAAELADLLQGAEDRLRQRAALRIEKMLFCRTIDDFGDYVARESASGIATFEGGSGDQAGEPITIYIELRNVSGKPHGDGYETHLVGSVELIDFENHSAFRKDLDSKPHLSQSPRHDFFVNCAFSVPRRVPPGRYTLLVEVRDVTGLRPDPTGAKVAPPGHRVAQGKLDLQVIEPRPERH